MPFNSYCKDKGREAHKVARLKAGLNPNLSLPEACANFYVLERLIADGSPSAEAQLVEYETELAKEFSAYLDIAVGGELRHVFHVNSNSSGDDECGDCCANALCRTSYCGCGDTKCEDPDCGCGDEDDDTGEQACEDPGCGCGDEVCETSYCGCCDKYEYDCSCGDCGACGGSNDDDWADRLHPILEKFALKVRTMVGHGDKMWTDDRALAWDQWVHIRHIHGIEAVAMARDCFNDRSIWHDGGFGGKPWGTAAGLLYDYLTAAISARVFINMAWSLQHNGGCIFNKVYNETSELQQVLELQARSTDYTKPVSNLKVRDTKVSLLECASDQVRKSWQAFAFIRSTKQGQQWIGHHKIELARTRLREEIGKGKIAAVGWQLQLDNLREQYWTSE